jgi:hypothetical protein
MSDIIASYRENVQASPVQLAHQLSMAEARIKTLETENRQLRSLRDLRVWEDKLYANPHLSPSHKLALRQAVITISKARKNESRELTKIYLPAIAQAIGLSAKTAGRTLMYLADAGAILREAETVTDDHGARRTHIAIGLTDSALSPDTIQPPQPRNHGGRRERCPACGSSELLEEKKIICTDCGEVISRTQRLVNPEPPTPDQDESRRDEENVTITATTAADSDSHPTSIPLDKMTAFIKPDRAQNSLTSGDAGPQQSQPPAVGESKIQEAPAHLLLDIAGDAGEHIVMRGRGAAKYITIHRPLTLTDIHHHLAGTKTIGATLARSDGTTRALCFDADDDTGWKTLEAAAAVLIASGFKPILEMSPAGRGGHLWLIFTDQVHGAAAYNQVCERVPLLKTIPEYWPRPGNQKVRLPLGKYIARTCTSWCSLLDHTGQERKGQDRALIIQTLLDHVTSSELIQKDPFPPDKSPAEERPVSPRRAVSPRKAGEPKAQPSGGVDQTWHRNYGTSTLWFAWTPQELARWYNERNAITDLLPPESNKHGLASWRGERTASVGYTKDGQGWVDFGATARRSDGTCDGGDSLELVSRIEQRSKAEIMREASREFVQEAKAALLSAAERGDDLPAWLVPFVMPAGLNHYRKCRERAESTREEAQCLKTHEPPYPPPTRACICCGVIAWEWTGEQYICSHPNHPKKT